MPTKVGGFKVGQIPIPIGWEGGSRNLARLAKAATEEHRQLQLAKTPHERTALSRQAEVSESKIDRFVYELYELTPEEIAIVERG